MQPLEMNQTNRMKIRFGLLLVISLFSLAHAGEEAEMNDFVGGVYDGDGTYATAGNVAVGAHGTIIKAGDTYFTPNGGDVFVGQATAISSGSTIFRKSWASR